MTQMKPPPGNPGRFSPLGKELENTKSVALIKTDQFEAIRLVVQKGAEIPPHDVPGRITLHCLEGQLELVLAKSSVKLAAGEWIFLEGGQSHSVRGIVNASLLLTIHFDSTRN